jgi:hypothetical protein
VATLSKGGEQIMTDTKKTMVVNPVVAGIAGAVAGGIAVAAAMSLNTKENKQKVNKAIDTAKATVAGAVENIKSQPVVQKSAHTVANAAGEVKKKIEATI